MEQIINLQILIFSSEPEFTGSPAPTTHMNYWQVSLNKIKWSSIFMWEAHAMFI